METDEQRYIRYIEDHKKDNLILWRSREDYLIEDRDAQLLMRVIINEINDVVAPDSLTTDKDRWKKYFKK